MPNENDETQPISPTAAESPQQPTQPQPGTASAPSAPSPTPEALDGPAWARGKTRDQLVREVEEFYNALPNMDFSNHAAQPQPQPQYGGYSPHSNPEPYRPNPGPNPQPNSPQNVSVPLPPDPDLAQTDPERWRREFDAYNRAVVQATISESANAFSRPLVESQAQTARELSRRDPRNSDIWERYGHEIDREAAQLPMSQRNKRAYDWIADMVAGRHRHDLAQNERATAANPTASSTPTAEPQQPTPASPLDSIWNSDNFYIRRLKDMGMTKNAIREQMKKMRKTEKQWVEMVEQGQLVISSDGKKQHVASSIASGE